MKKTIVATFFVLVLAGLALAIIPTTRDEIHWQWVSYNDDATSYESYLEVWPEGRHAVEARSMYDEQGWVEAIKTNTVQALERYVRLHGEGKYVSEAKNLIDSLHWQQANNINTIRSYQSYTITHPQGKFALQAKTNASALQIDQLVYNAALQEGTESSLRNFLIEYPGHKNESEAQQAIIDITEGRDIVDLLKEKKIEIKTEGNGIQSVSVSMRKLVPYSLTARIPVGTFFVSANSSSQNMVTTAETRIRLDTDEWQDASPDAACANRPRDIPDSDDRFTIRRSPHQAELARLIPVLDKENVSYAVRQAAVWIVTDNANYDDLGILVIRSQFDFFGGTREINEYEAASAMRICEKSGINIKTKSIWYDRKTILSGLEDEDLKKWLVDKK